MNNQEPLSNEQLRQLIESNARAIQGNSESIAELRQQISETDRIVRANSTAITELRQQIGETNQIVREGFQTVQSDIQQLARLFSQLFQGQASHNRIIDGALEDHEHRIEQLEANESGS